MFAANLFKFIQVLRQLGLIISYSEIEDFLKSLDYINLTHKNQLLWLMQSTLIKREQDIPILNAAFNSFFGSAEKMEDIINNWSELVDKLQQSKEKAEEDLIFNDEPIALSDEDKVFYGELSNEQQEKIKKFLEQSTHGKHMNPEKFRPVIEDLVKSHLKYWKKQINYVQPFEVELTGDPSLDQYLYNTHLELVKQGYISGKDLKDLNPAEMGEAKRLLKKLAKRFATKISRRYSLSKRAKLIDIRKTIRGNIGYGGVPLKLKYRNKRVQKPSILLLVDVSGSMIRYSAFIIQFIYFLSEVVNKIDTFIFSEKTAKLLTKQIKSWDLIKLEEYIENHPIYGEGTDIQNALKFVNEKHKKLLSQKTVVIIVSDTKTLKLKETAIELVKVKDRVKNIIWLNPLPKRDWPSQPSVELFKNYSDMYPCNTLSNLEELINKQII